MKKIKVAYKVRLAGPGVERVKEFVRFITEYDAKNRLQVEWMQTLTITIVTGDSHIAVAFGYFTSVVGREQFSWTGVNNFATIAQNHLLTVGEYFGISDVEVTHDMDAKRALHIERKGFLDTLLKLDRIIDNVNRAQAFSLSSGVPDDVISDFTHGLDAMISELRVKIQQG